MCSSVCCSVYIVKGRPINTRRKKKPISSLFCAWQLPRKYSTLVLFNACDVFGRYRHGARPSHGSRFSPDFVSYSNRVTSFCRDGPIVLIRVTENLKIYVRVVFFAKKKKRNQVRIEIVSSCSRAAATYYHLHDASLTSASHTLWPCGYPPKTFVVVRQLPNIYRTTIDSCPIIFDSCTLRFNVVIIIIIIFSIYLRRERCCKLGVVNTVNIIYINNYTYVYTYYTHTHT